MSLTDTHCHLDLAAFDADREAVVGRAREAGVSRMVVPAVDLESSRRIVSLGDRRLGLFAAIGIHPTEAAGTDEHTLASLHGLAANPMVVAIGEIGLDYYWVSDSEARTAQRVLFQRQLHLAGEVGLPAIMHLREAADAEDGPCSQDLLSILNDWVHGLRQQQHSLASRPGVLHSFSGTLETAYQAIALGFYIGITGPVTFKNAASRRELVRQLPLDRILLETDSPYLAPAPHRGQRNEPAFVTHIADKIAEIKSRTVAEVALVTQANAARVFAWGETA